jgi:glycosyltransferase involved in cell wall biosynthesis
MTGAGRYVFEVARRLPALCPDIEFVLLLTSNLEGTPLYASLIESGITVRIVDAPVASLRQWVVVPAALRGLSPDIYHYPFLDLPWVPFRTVVTVYDLNPLTDPQYFGSWRSAKRWLARKLVASSLRRCSAVCAISESTRKELIDLFPPAAPKVRVVPLGVDIEHWRNGNALAVANDQGRESRWTGRSYFLYVGVDRPHKNLARVIRAFSAFRAAEGWDRGGGPYLLLAGVGRDTPALRAIIQTCSLESDVLTADSLDEGALISAYAGATAVIYASTSEGFGLPILEAFAAGAPVIAGDLSSLPEVAGNAAEYCSPLDVHSIAGAIGRVWRDGDLRGTLRARGRVRVEQFTWATTARRTADVYREVVAGGRLVLGG